MLQDLAIVKATSSFVSSSVHPVNYWQAHPHWPPCRPIQKDTYYIVCADHLDLMCSIIICNKQALLLKLGPCRSMGTISP